MTCHILSFFPDIFESFTVIFVFITGDATAVEFFPAVLEESIKENDKSSIMQSTTAVFNFIRILLQNSKSISLQLSKVSLLSLDLLLQKYMWILIIDVLNSLHTR